MKLKNYFNIKRFWLLLKLELFKSRKGIVMTIVITFGMLFLIGLLFSILVVPNMIVYEHSGSYVFMLLTGGFILSSLAFNDLGSTLKRYNYLTLPVSAFEKFFCMWLLTSVGWIILFTITYTFYTIIANIIGPIIFRQVEFLAFKPWNELVLHAVLYYFVLHGIFLVGAAKFKGYVFPKTLFTIIIFGVVCGFIIYFIMSDMFELDSEIFEDPKALEGMAIHKIWIGLQWAFWWILAPLSWVVTYLALKEKEV